MTNENEWWLKKFNEKNWGACFECCDYEGMVDDIRGILSEHTRRIVEAVEGMKNDATKMYSSTYHNGAFDINVIENPLAYQWNTALDEAIKIINQQDI